MANEATLDPRKVMTGHDGKLYITIGGKSIFMANVDTFQAQINFQNTDFHPVGDLMTYAIPIGFSCTLTYTEAVISDEFVMGPILDALAQGYVPTFDFRGTLDRAYDSQSQELVYGNCVPDGAFDIQNLTPGEVIKRAMSYRVNTIPKYLNKLVA
jgi:hypothetical protein